MPFSIGCETSVSTSSADKPGASVWITTWVGENSGNTSKLALLIRYKPYTITAIAKAITTPARRMEKRTMDAIKEDFACKLFACVASLNRRFHLLFGNEILPTAIIARR